LQVFESNVSDRDQSDELRSYPQDMLTSPLNQMSARFAFQPTGGQATGSAPLARQPGVAATDGAFAALIAVPQLDLQVVLLALVTAVGLGALHALEPGHGKTVAAAYLVGSRATARHVMLLGLTVTAMHTSSVFALGLVTLFASRFIVPERLLPWLALGSGLIVIMLGVRMLLSRLHGHAAGSTHSHLHDHRGHDHSHDHHGHSHTHDHDHDHLRPGLTGSAMNWRSVLAIGVSGGLLPCPAALVVLLSAIGLGRVGFGLLLIVAFSVGLALVLSAVGFAVLYGGRWFSRSAPAARLLQQPAIARLSRFVPAVSGLMVVMAGALLLYHALPLLRLWEL
jgi:ABC-type nickel/cobalt efflux system permease component RcnA